MRILVSTILAIMIFCTSLSAQDWFVDDDEIGGWEETFTVRVLDQSMRPIKGAKVNASWELNHVRGDVWSENKYSDSQGRAGPFSIASIEYSAEKTKYKYAIHASYDDQRASLGVEPGEYSDLKTIKLPVYMVTFQVTDPRNKSLSIPLRVDDRYDLKTERDGRALIQLGEGKHYVVPRISDIESKKGFRVGGKDLTVPIKIKLYNLDVKVMDDQGKPINARVHVGAQSLRTDIKGIANFSNISGSDAAVTAYYGKNKKVIAIDLEQENFMNMIFDTHPPIIEKVENEFKDQNLIVRAMIRDQNTFASGLVGKDASVEIYYIDTETGSQKKVSMYSTGKDLYEGIVPTTINSKTLRYVVQAKDAEGNIAQDPVTFLVPTKGGGSAPAPKRVPIEMEGEDNSSALNEILKTVAPLFAVIMILGVLAVIGIWYYNSKKAPSELGKKMYSYNSKRSWSKGNDIKIPKVPDNKRPPAPPKLKA